MPNILKIIVLGEPNVGKSSLIQRYIDSDHKSRKSDDIETLTADFVEKRVLIDDKEMTVAFWDQPSQNPPNSFYHGAHGCCLIFSTIDADSLRKLQNWYEHVQDYCTRGRSKAPPIVIAENKIDLIEKTVMNEQEVENASKKYKLRLYRTSAKFGHQVNDMFEYITGKAAKYESEEKGNSREIHENGSLEDDDKAVATRTPSTASWTLPLTEGDEKTQTASEPSKRRTGGVKPIFNKNKCPVM